MKTSLLNMGFVSFIVLTTACNNGGTTTTTDSTMVTSGDIKPSNVSASKNITVHFDPEANYVDLKTGKPIKLKVDTSGSSIVEEESNQPVTYYVNPATNDTFDGSGRMVNRALIKGANGEYTIVESKITVTSVDAKNVSSSDTASDVTVESSPVKGNKKKKMKGDATKQNTDTSKLRTQSEDVN